MIERFRTNPSFGEIVARRFNRREVLQGLAAAAPALAIAPLRAREGVAVAPESPAFTSIRGSKDDRVILPAGYHYDVVIRWGDSLMRGVADLDPYSVVQGALLEEGAAQAQAGQFGYNCDAVNLFPVGSDGSRGLLCVNNEYTNDELLFPGRRFEDRRRPEAFRAYLLRYPQTVSYTQAAHGISVVEIQRIDGHWRALRTSALNRRVTGTSPIEIKGPARGATLMRTSYDREGVLVRGTLANCAGGRTPWGTYLSAEENIEDYFGNYAGLRARDDISPQVLEAHRRFWLWERSSFHGWEVVDSRFDVAREPTEALRFGWVVELDPYDPRRRPCKRTALGRFAHEGASPIIAADERVAVYMGDDEKFEYVYKFVTRDRYAADDPERNRDLLDHGTLYAARFDADGSGQWLPLVWSEQGPLSPATGYASQADVLIRTRAAADQLGATPMDRPEDVEPDPGTGRIYIACTKNESREPDRGAREYNGRSVEHGPNAPNPRGPNLRGHVIELIEEHGDHTGRRFRWELFLLAGNPQGGRLFTRYADALAHATRVDDAYYAGQSDAARLSGFGCPDNLGFDAAGHLWIATDGEQPDGMNNGVLACPTRGPDRGVVRRFMSAPVGAEVCGCEVTPDGATLFLSIQHPGEGGHITDLCSHWPDGGEAAPRPSVVAIRRRDGGPVGS